MMVRREIAEKPGEGQVAQGGRKDISSGRPSPLAPRPSLKYWRLQQKCSCIMRAGADRDKLLTQNLQTRNN